MMVGHLGELALSSSSIAISLAGVTGFSFLVWLVHWKRCVDKLMELDSTENLEWWSFELLILLSGLLPHPELETSVLSVWNVHLLSFGIDASAVSTPFQHFMPYYMDLVLQQGAGNPQAARVAINEKEMVDSVTSMAPMVCVSVILDGLQGVLQGVARGSGWQHIGAYVNLGAFYLVGIPAAATLAFWLQLKGIGLWVGIQSGSLTQNILLAIVTSCVNWEEQASKARERLFHGSSSMEYGTMTIIFRKPYIKELCHFNSSGAFSPWHPLYSGNHRKERALATALSWWRIWNLHEPRCLHLERGPLGIRHM
ncbi:MATE efflux family protein 9-like [Hibiscus syriacus]|uniref:MATE efflux family protein 9-like n=1 Tax=Hibiscus syriacus TaxID=106335 RepID=A0A6A3CST6_HIBSY|nr:MATE efflux family protein 9-like [Hibiscus syriacus]